MPHGLKKYLKNEILPEFHLKPGGKGFSLSTMQRLMLNEDCTYMEHKKAVYYDGHEQPDVVKDRQKHFIPQFAALHHQIVRYVAGNVKQAVEHHVGDPNINFVETRLVLCAHDETAAQANDGLKWSWVLNGEQPLCKKGQG